MTWKRNFVCLLLCLVGCGTARVPANASLLQEGTAKPAQASGAKTDVVKTPVDPEKEKSIRKLLEMTGAAKVGVQVSKQLIASMRQSIPSVPDEFWTEFAKKIKPEDFVDLIIPIYDKHFLKEDIDSMIAFYASPVGQKFVAALPMITQESMQAGEQWGQAKGEEAVRELQKRYPRPDKATPKTQAGKSKSASESKGKNKQL